MDIEERFARLEQQNRNLKKGIILVVVFISVSLAALTGCLVMMSKTTFDVIKAKQFQVIGGED